MRGPWLATMVSALGLTACGSVEAPAIDEVVPCAECSVEDARTRLRVSTSSLPDAVVGTAYAAQLEATGGRRPYTWRAVGLPAGLTVGASGAVSGNPTSAGVFPITIAVTDAVGRFASRALSLTVAQVSPAPPPPPSPPPPLSPPPSGDESDGFANAPSCTIQYPNLLAGYAHPPTWHVAGVHYCVGYPASTALKNPATIAMPGVSVDTGSRRVTVTGNDVTLDGYAFDGWDVFVQAQNTRIVNSRFTGGGVPFTHYAYGDAANLYIGYSVIDGADSAEFLIDQNYAGLTVEYCWLKNSGSDIVGFRGDASGAAILRFNVIENAGMIPGAHGDYTQFIGGPYRAVISYNTTLQDGGTTQGFMVEPDIGSSSGTILSGDIGHNTFTANGGGLSFFTAVTVPDIVESFVVHDNFFDDSNVYGFAIGGIRGGPSDGSSKTTYTNNVDMVTGSVVADP